MDIRIGHRVASTTAEGPGQRFALWVQGCTIRCPGCCNPGLFPKTGGTIMPVDDLAAEILASPTEGLSILGGEPFEQPEACAELARLVRAGGKTVMVYTGYLHEDLRLRPETAAFLDQIDILVDGPYDRTKPEQVRRWIGSQNQRVLFLTEAYTMDAAWDRSDEVVITLRKGQLEIHGWPGAPVLLGRR